MKNGYGNIANMMVELLFYGLGITVMGAAFLGFPRDWIVLSVWPVALGLIEATNPGCFKISVFWMRVVRVMRFACFTVLFLSFFGPFMLKLLSIWLSRL